MKKKSKKCSTDQRFIRKRNTIQKIGTLIEKLNDVTIIVMERLNDVTTVIERLNGVTTVIKMHMKT